MYYIIATYSGYDTYYRLHSTHDTIFEV